MLAVDPASTGRTRIADEQRRGPDVDDQRASRGRPPTATTSVDGRPIRAAERPGRRRRSSPAARLARGRGAAHAIADHGEMGGLVGEEEGGRAGASTPGPRCSAGCGSLVAAVGLARARRAAARRVSTTFVRSIGDVADADDRDEPPARRRRRPARPGRRRPRRSARGRASPRDGPRRRGWTSRAAIEPVWRTKSASEVGQDEPGEDEDRVGHQWRHRRPGEQRPHDAGELADRAEVGAIGRDGDRRPADAEALGRVGPAQPVDEDRPGDLALAIGQVGEQIAEERRRARRAARRSPGRR